MNRRDRGWPGGLSSLWAMGGLLLVGAMARGESPPPLADQLLDLGRQAVAQGAIAQAETFYRKASTLDPGHAGARRALEGLPRIGRVSLARPAGGGGAAARGEPAQATIEVLAAHAPVLRQQLTNEVGRRLRASRLLAGESRHEAA